MKVALEQEAINICQPMLVMPIAATAADTQALRYAFAFGPLTPLETGLIKLVKCYG